MFVAIFLNFTLIKLHHSQLDAFGFMSSGWTHKKRMTNFGWDVNSEFSLLSCHYMRRTKFKIPNRRVDSSSSFSTQQKKFCIIYFGRNEIERNHMKLDMEWVFFRNLLTILPQCNQRIPKTLIILLQLSKNPLTGPIRKMNWSKTTLYNLYKSNT